VASDYFRRMSASKSWAAKIVGAASHYSGAVRTLSMQVVVRHRRAITNPLVNGSIYRLQHVAGGWTINAIEASCPPGPHLKPGRSRFSSLLPYQDRWASIRPNLTSPIFDKKIIWVCTCSRRSRYNKVASNNITHLIFIPHHQLFHLENDIAVSESVINCASLDIRPHTNCVLYYPYVVWVFADYRH
jgi:hypothetical protein